jgi:hypothetical protein
MMGFAVAQPILRAVDDLHDDLEGLRRKLKGLPSQHRIGKDAFRSITQFDCGDLAKQKA